MSNYHVQSVPQINPVQGSMGVQSVYGIQKSGKAPEVSQVISGPTAYDVQGPPPQYNSQQYPPQQYPPQQYPPQQQYPQQYPPQQYPPQQYPPQQYPPQQNGSPSWDVQNPVGGLAILDRISKLEMKERVNVAEMVIGVELGNNFKLVANDGEFQGEAKEKSNVMMNYLLPLKRPFTQKFFLNNQKIFSVKREYAFFGEKVKVKSNKSTVAEVDFGVLASFFLMRNFTVKDPNTHEIVLTAKGFAPICCLCGKHPWTYKVYDQSGEQVATIAKNFSGVLKELFTDADNFTVEFLKPIPAAYKAALLAIVLLVNIRYYSSAQAKQQNRNNAHHQQVGAFAR